MSQSPNTPGQHENKDCFPRFAYFGTPSVASDTLVILIENNIIPTVVVTSPDAPKGRGHIPTPSPTKTLALAHKIPVLTPTTLDAETIEEIHTRACEFAIVVAYGKIFPDELITAFPLGVLNVHYSLLPKYRGATPLESAILAGEHETGVTIQKMVKKLDAGDIISQEKAMITPAETIREVRPRLVVLGANMLVRSLPQYVRNTITPVQQDASQATHTHKLKKEDGLLSLDDPAEKNWNTYRAYADSIGTYFFKDNKRFKITVASLQNGAFVIERVIPEGKCEMVYAP